MPLAAIDSVNFVSLQKGKAAVQTIEQEFPFFGSDLMMDKARDFTDTAAIVAELDLVITVDTSVAHLAGSMGKPVWILLSNLPDWRWGLHSDTTAWYSSARLFRQTFLGKWEELLKEVASELSILAGFEKRQAKRACASPKCDSPPMD